MGPLGDSPPEPDSRKAFPTGSDSIPLEGVGRTGLNNHQWKSWVECHTVGGDSCL